MKKKIKFFIAVICIILTLNCFTPFSFDANTDIKQSESKKKIVGYLPDWSYSFYTTMNFNELTHLNIAFCNPDTTGQLSCYIPDKDFNDIVQKAHTNNVSVLASLGGAGGSQNYTELISSTEKINEFNKKILDFCKKYNLDGIDLDIEGEINPEFWNYYEEWCISLRKLCDENDLLLTNATAYWVSMHSSEKVFKCFDFLNIMAYDNDVDPASHSSYDYALYCLDYFNNQRGIPKEKLVLGVPFYGRGYNEDGTLNWSSYIPFSKIIAQDSSYYQKDVFNGIVYNGAATISAKCDIAQNYGGIMIWEISQDAKGEYSLLTLISNKLRESNNIIGDIDGDGIITVGDCIYMIKYLHGAVAFTDIEYKNGDLNSDGIINIADLCMLKNSLI